ncbi:MAG: NAD(P)H-hydrate dehydratase [Actinobacteria bacterium]|nr:NAD(P)H-hydrate dehydratase [Actinomycetota bacterium]
MRPVLTATEYRRVESSHPEDLGEAMERAGRAVALAAARHGAGYGSKVVVLAGPGNNGGDGYVAARLLRRRGVAVEVHTLGDPRTDLAREAAARARREGVRIEPMSGPVTADLVIDAVFGGGARAGLPPEALRWTETPAPVIAVDFPSGLDPDTGEAGEAVFSAVETITFGTLKTGHVCGSGPDHCGTLTVAGVGIDGGEPSMYVAEESDAPRPRRPRAAHKWSAGSVLVVSGSPGMVGAGVLAARAALSFGAGSVYFASASPEQVQLLASEIPALTLADAEASLDRFDVVVAGPGLGAHDVSPVIPLVGKAQRVVLDAGGLVAEMTDAAAQGGGEVIVTPHAAEFRRMAGVGGGKFSTRSYARRKGLILVHKGNPTLVTDGGPPILITTGTPDLATIGTGDVLTGMIAALWARGLDAMGAAVSATYWHGVAGADLAAERSVTADLLADRVGSLAW